MANTLSTRIIAEHLSTLASVLDAEAARAQALGLRTDRDLAREAREVRTLCNMLWEADAELRIEEPGNAVGRSSAKIVSIGTVGRRVPC